MCFTSSEIEPHPTFAAIAFGLMFRPNEDRFVEQVLSNFEAATASLWFDKKANLLFFFTDQSSYQIRQVRNRGYFELWQSVTIDGTYRICLPEWPDLEQCRQSRLEDEWIEIDIGSPADEFSFVFMDNATKIVEAIRIPLRIERHILVVSQYYVVAKPEGMWEGIVHRFLSRPSCYNGIQEPNNQPCHLTINSV